MTATLHLTHQCLSHQGTGALLGAPTYFVRFAGCSVLRCPIRKDCDEPDALRVQNGFEASPQKVVDNALDAVGVGGWIHITGGEPTDQPEALGHLVQLARRARLRTQLQTAGLTRIETPVDWISVSPKTAANGLQQRAGEELILVYEDQDIEEILAYSNETAFTHYYIQPKWVAQPSWPKGEAINNRKTVEMALRLNAKGSPWHLTLQAHKYLGVY